MLLADILERDAKSILLDAYEATAPFPTAFLGSRTNFNNTKKPTLTILDIPDEIINRILDFHFESPKHQAYNTRLVNKRLATLALPHSLRTISVDSGKELLRLVSAPLSPLYHRFFGEHVRCFEFAFITENYELVGVDTQLPLALPNLETVRLRFTLGIPVDCGYNIQTLLSEDTLCRAVRTATNASWHRFLSQFQPKNFEWISSDSSKLYLVGMFRDLRLLFRSWTSLTAIYLEGICLVEQCELTTWSLAFISKRLHIRGAFSMSDSFFLAGLQNVKDPSRCHALLLETSRMSDKEANVGNVVPVVTIGSTVVSLKGWHPAARQVFTDNLTRKIELPSLEGRQGVQAQTDLKEHQEPIKAFLFHLFFGTFMALLFCAKIFDSPTYFLQNIQLYSSPSACYSPGTQNTSRYFQEIFPSARSSFRDRLFGRTAPVYQRGRSLYKGNFYITGGVPT